jgi:hypothetical protein
MSDAERLLWDYGVVAPEHIDLATIAFDHGAEVKYRFLGGCEARLVARGDRAIISISSESNTGRQRFSLGHELAHWLCDRNTGAFLCAKEDIGPENAEAKLVEGRANNYASQLILPTYLVDPWLQGRKITLETAAQLGEAFTTSLTAAAIKMAKRATIPACLLCHSQTGLAWRQQSLSFPQEFFLASELHYETDAFRMIFSPGSEMSRPRRQPASLWFSGRGADRFEVTTQSLKVPGDRVITMLTFA